MSRALDTLILIGLVAAAILLVIALVMNIELVLTVVILIVFLVLVAIVILGLAGLIAAVPFYFLKGGKGPEPGSYKVEDMKPVKEDERK
jgi:hypothetical protein